MIEHIIIAVLYLLVGYAFAIFADMTPLGRFGWCVCWLPCMVIGFFVSIYDTVQESRE